MPKLASITHVDSSATSCGFINNALVVWKNHGVVIWISSALPPPNAAVLPISTLFCCCNSKQSSNRPSLKNYLTIGGCFKHYTYRVTALGWLNKEEGKKERKKERKKMNNSDFWPFQVCHFKIVNYTLLLLVQTGSGSISCSMYVL